MTIKHPITGERTGYFDENATALKVGDTVELFGQNGTVTFDGIVFQNGVPWEAIKDKVWQLYKSSPCLVNKTNFLSFIETIIISVMTLRERSSRLSRKSITRRLLTMTKKLAESYKKAYGFWEVTTEGDCEGRSVSRLGIYEGYIDEIALALADRCYYSLCFRPIDPRALDLTPKRKSVEISFDIGSNTWDMDNEGIVAAFKEVLKDRPVYVHKGRLFSSVNISTEEESEEEKRQKS